MVLLLENLWSGTGVALCTWYSDCAGEPGTGREEQYSLAYSVHGARPQTKRPPDSPGKAARVGTLQQRPTA
ncbi:uncharacterized protein FFB20_11518 [Fusarium fujikuroi]|uniref:Uncharacterized protein n=1 Tax=Fusarium proliferatum (strain ET1) TaxID=1227346 RepID=A0A1L7VFZ3_FUSPR|nr:uncharacterized protein FPRO_04448 [Fusarium proliferatum ET1]CVK93185.1 uncharacterized protein FPRN_04318 [Fusarium proliferatum]SCN76434.1 uncharacterized protein FFE2_03508 [Fusarium fujikuroi]CZR39551.1 uncharacterized protein FPRO_04448 [Fusarium proliferatum ET1]SCN78375.1 uncharacterized protein FFM5_01846 [Fusarium fujikuroi]SCN94682.1 uncharacterized protein FFC1_07087 [Fusarium fujikuroi]